MDCVQFLSGATSLACAGLIASIVLSQKIKEGVAIKCGLVMMIIGLMASGLITLKGFDDLEGLWNAALLLRTGLLVTALGVIWLLRTKMEGRL